MKKIIKSSVSFILALTIILSSAYAGLAEFGFSGLFVVEAGAANSGICGENLTWSLDSGVLTISGTGPMSDYSKSSHAPWSRLKSNIKLLVIDNGVTTIGDYAFNDCRLMYEVEISNSVVDIGDYAFSDCRYLRKIVIPDSVLGIGDYAFNRCKDLGRVTISNSVKSIGTGVFNCCYELKSIIIPNGVESIGDYGFYGCYNLKSLIVPSGVISIGEYAFADCNYLESVVLQDGVTSIGEFAFYDCYRLESITIPDSVTCIGVSAFDDTAYYKNPDNWEDEYLYIGKHLMKTKNSINGHCDVKSGTITIAGLAFADCTKLVSVSIPDSVINIGAFAFENCGSLVSVAVPESVITIGEGAFKGCKLLSSVTIPDSVTGIGDYALGYDSDNVKINDFVVCGTSGTIAEDYVNKNGFLFVDVRHNHVALDWQIVQESSVLLPGIKVKECTICRKVIGIEIKPLLTPEAPIVKTENYHGSVMVRWNDVAGADDYVVYRRVYDPKTKKWSGWSRIADGITKYQYSDETVDYCDKNVQSGTYYIYTVKARNDGGYGSYTSGSKVYYISLPELTSIEHNQKTITFKWEKVQGATGYIVYRRDLDGSDKWTAVATTMGTTYIDKNIKVGEHYKYTVKAYYGSYRSHFYEGGLQIIILLTPKLKSVSCDKKGVSIKWGESAGADRYIVYRRTYNAKTKKWSGWTRIADDILGTSYVDKTAKSGTYYIYTIKAEAKESSRRTYSGYDKNGLKLYFLATPSMKSATSTKTGVKLQWTKVGGATGYKVYRKTGNNPWGEAIATVKGISNTTYVDKTAKKGVTYTYTVRAYNGSNKSSYIPAGGTVKDKY